MKLRTSFSSISIFELSKYRPATRTTNTLTTSSNTLTNTGTAKFSNSEYGISTIGNVTDSKTNFDQNEQKTTQPQKETTILPNAGFIDTKDFDFDQTEMKYDSTGMFHWCAARFVMFTIDSKNFSSKINFPFNFSSN